MGVVIGWSISYQYVQKVSAQHDETNFQIKNKIEYKGQYRQTARRVVQSNFLRWLRTDKRMMWQQNNTEIDRSQSVTPFKYLIGNSRLRTA